MEIKTERLLLRDHFEEDWCDIHEYASIPEFSQYDVWGPNSEQDSKEFVKRMMEQALDKPRYKYDLAVVHLVDKKVIGGIGVRRCTEKSLVCDLGYAINPNYQNQGFASEAVKAMLDFAFSNLKVALVFATCDCNNTASYKVMEKVGMKKVGQIVKHKEFKGSWHDSFRYEMVNPLISL